MQDIGLRFRNYDIKCVPNAPWLTRSARPKSGASSGLLRYNTSSMNWINKEFERRQREHAAINTSVVEQSGQNQLLSKGVPLAWKRLVDMMVADLEAFNSHSDIKASQRIHEGNMDVHWQGKKGPLLTLSLDPAKASIVYSRPSEPPKKLKIEMNDSNEPYLWTEGEGRMTFERASELLLKPALFP
jgi:hypothetical protein